MNFILILLKNILTESLWALNITPTDRHLYENHSSPTPALQFATTDSTLEPKRNLNWTRGQIIGMN